MAALVAIAADEADGQPAIIRCGGPGPLMTIALGPNGWLRQQAVEVLRLLGYALSASLAHASQR